MSGNVKVKDKSGERETLISLYWVALLEMTISYQEGGAIYFAWARNVYCFVSSCKIMVMELKAG